MSWRCGVCDGVNQGGQTCTICGASRAAAVPIDPPAVAPSSPPRPNRTQGRSPAPPVGPNRTRVPDAAPPSEPPRQRGLFRRLVDAATRAVERAITPSPPSDEPPPEPDAESRPRRRSRMRVRPFPFGILVTWENDPDDDSR